jgi:hypothetical protein
MWLRFSVGNRTPVVEALVTLLTAMVLLIHILNYLSHDAYEIVLLRVMTRLVCIYLVCDKIKKRDVSRHL